MANMGIGAKLVDMTQEEFKQHVMRVVSRMSGNGAEAEDVKAAKLRMQANYKLAKISESAKAESETVKTPESAKAESETVKTPESAKAESKTVKAPESAKAESRTA